MSLIDEALKRAEAAADREAPRKRPWVPAPLPDAGLARRRRFIRATATGLAAGLGIAALAALLIWAARGSQRPARSGAAAGSAEPRAAVPVPTEARTGGGPGGEAPPPPAAGAVASMPTPRAAAAAPTPRAVAVPPSAASGARAGRTLVPSIETTPVHVAPPSRPAEMVASASGSPRVHASPAAAAGKSYHGKVTLPDGGSLELGGIVWSESDPRALVNDRVVGVGAYVQGYTIETIEEDRVVLEKDGKRITVTVK